MNSGNETQLRVLRYVNPELEWLTGIQAALWDRFGGQIRIIDEPTVTLLGSGELSYMQKTYRDIGSLTTEKALMSIRDNMPESFERTIDARTKNKRRLYVRQNPGGSPKLALGFSDPRLSSERVACTEAIDRLSGVSLPWRNGRYVPNLSVADAIGRIHFRDLVDGLSDFAVPTLELLEGDIVGAD